MNHTLSSNNQRTLGTTLFTNTSLLFSLIPIILPSMPHWGNLLSKKVSSSSLCPTKLPINLPAHLPFTTPPAKLQVSNPIIEYLFSLRTCINLLTNILLPIFLLPFKFIPPLILESMPYFLEDITHNTMHLASSGLNWMQESTST